MPRSIVRVLWALKRWRDQIMRKEPVLGGALISVAVALAAAFGLELDAEEVAITVSVVATIVAFVQRKLVTPNAKK